MRKCFPHCSLLSQDIRHHPEMAYYRSCRACNRVVKTTPGWRTYHPAQSHRPARWMLQAAGVACNLTPPHPEVNIIAKLPQKQTRNHQESNMK